MHDLVIPLILLLISFQVVISFRLDSIIHFPRDPIQTESSHPSTFYHLQLLNNQPVILYNHDPEPSLEQLYSKPFVMAASKMCLSSYSPPSVKTKISMQKVKFGSEKYYVKNDEKKENNEGLLDPLGSLFLLRNDDDDDDDKGLEYDRDDSFGWNSSALRGHVYSSWDKRLVVIAIKGTSIPYADDKETVANDKYNDNMMFSCCCARVAYSYSSICDCPVKFGVCNETCLSTCLKQPQKPSYYELAKIMFQYVTSLYPSTTQVWLTGHSLGGALAALTAMTFDTVALTIEAPGEALYAKRIGLQPSEQSLAKIFHLGNDLDPIFLGKCNGIFSSCYLGGYAMETACHLGNVCTLKLSQEDGDNGDREDPPDPYRHRPVYKSSPLMLGPKQISSASPHIEYHRLTFVINKIISLSEDLPICERQDPCSDCPNWSYS